MGEITRKHTTDWVMAFICLICIAFSFLILSSVAPYVFPGYFVYAALGIILFFGVSRIDFEVVKALSAWSFVISIAILVLTLIIGQVTRGTVRWLNVGQLSVQPAEIARPFIFIYAAAYFSAKDISLKRYVRGVVLFALPTLLILIQPSLGVSIVTAAGLVAIAVVSKVPRKYLLATLAVGVITLPLFWLALAPYQRSRLTSFLSPQNDPFGAGYNSVQSMIAVGSGQLKGRGLGQGVQTQLSFLPEQQTDFVFASIAEELGAVGAVATMIIVGILLWRIAGAAGSPQEAQRYYCVAVFVSLLAQSAAHMGMNMGMLPITGLPLPLISAGGSSLLATLISLGLVSSARQNG